MATAQKHPSSAWTPPTLRKHESCPVLGCSGGTVFNPALAGSDSYRVALVGEAPGETEAGSGKPFDGKAGFKLTRLIEWAGLERARFDIWNVCWCRPPDNLLEGMPYESAAIEWWKPYWRPLLSRVNVVVPMGNVALNAFTGRKGILTARGYFTHPGPDQAVAGAYHLLPTVHPSFIQRGQSKYSAAFIHDIQKAVGVARDGMEFTTTDYVLDPSPDGAFQWALAYRDVLSKQPSTRLAYDIETPYNGDDETEYDLDDPSYFIWRIGFSYQPNTALSIPWEAPYIPAIKLLLGSSGDKVVWNAGFDNPRIKHNGVTINGLIHDGMVAWHILHSDLPKGLGFVATFTCPFQTAWKHLSKQQPAFYNATDADVELRSFLTIEQELRETGLWSVYQRDVLDLDPLLIYMSQMGMPIDPVVREDRAHQLATRQASCLAEMNALVPIAARRIEQVYKNVPKDTTGLLTRPGRRTVGVCSGCGYEKPTKAHFRLLKKKINPCAGLGVELVERDVEEYYRLADFSPSRHQLIAYQAHMGRGVPSKYDKRTHSRKPSMDEKALKTLMKKFPLDKLYPTVIQFRELQKVAGTYIGYPEDAIQGSDET